MCPVTDVVGAIIDAVGDAGVAAGVGDAAVDAGVAGAADAGIGAGVAAGAGDAALGAGLDAGVGAGVADLGAGAGLDAGLGAAGLDAGVGAGTADLGAGALDAGLGAGDAAAAGAGGVDATTAALPAGAAGAPGAGGATLDAINVTAPSLAPGSAAAGGTGGISDLLGSSALAAAGAGGGGSGVPGAASVSPGADQPLTASNTPPGVTDIGQTLDSGQFLSANDTGPSLQNLDPNLAGQLGIDPSGGFNSGSVGGDFDLTNAEVSPADTGIDPNAPAGGGSGGGLGGDLSKWFSSPKNIGTAGLLGLSLKNALTKPSLPSADTTASNAATQAVQSATSVVQSGGTATPEWASQKASIDATINQQIQQQTQAIMQAAASSGEGNQNSGIVQQQIAQMTANANTQRQQLYAQAQQQNVSNALSELNGGDQVLTSIGNTQLQESEQAQALAAQTAELALLLQSGTGQVKLPGGTGIPGGP
jgi:hypothetical protein